MSSHSLPLTPVRDSSEAACAFLRDVRSGLSLENKILNCKYFYDERGSRLFDQICELDEYYPTRVESAIMSEFAGAMAKLIGPDAVLVEYGSGSSTKTRLLLDHLQDLKAYLPVDISGDHLQATARRLKADYPGLDIHPIVADFTVPFELPFSYGTPSTSVYFPGSTIGNLTPDQAVVLLQSIADQCGNEGGLLVGFDLAKDESVMQAAYDDSEGVTAEFNLNLLRRINTELGANFDIERFAHVAAFNRNASRVEIFIESLDDQTVCIGDDSFVFEQGERILTEYSHKYSVDQFLAMASKAGLVMDRLWTDRRDYFAVMHLSPAGCDA